MDEGAKDMESQPTDKPENNEDYCDCIEHVIVGVQPSNARSALLSNRRTLDRTEQKRSESSLLTKGGVRCSARAIP